jgi:Ca-activated chloride channel family protein
MTFAQPGWLALALLLPVAAVLAVQAASRGRRADTLAYSDLPFLIAATGTTMRWERIFGGALAAALALAGLALAGPRVTLPVPVRDGGVALCIDTSGSMSATDVAPTRAEAALAASRRFIEALPAGTHIAILAFASSAAVIFPASDDRTAAAAALADLPPPNGGTAIGDCLLLAARSLPPLRKRAIVLVTDGVNNSGNDPIDAARRIAADRIAIYTIGIGTANSGQLIPGTSEEAELDEDTLRTIADLGGGAYARASDAATLQAQLGDFARSATFERRPVELALPLALIASFGLVLTGLGAYALGRFP